jgi:hypothetical protein
VAGGGDGKKERNGGAHIWRGKWRASRNGGWEGEFGGASKMEGHLEVLLELCFFTKPLKFGVEAHMEAPTGVALINIIGGSSFLDQLLYLQYRCI